MARITLVPQRKEFFNLYNRSAANAAAISQVLVDLLGRKPDGETADLIREIKELEHEGDRLTHEVVDLLNRTFVTPFDRDDMYRLAGALDDVCDHVDETAGKVLDYGVRDVRPHAIDQARVIHRSANKLQDAIGQLEGFAD